MDQLAINGGTAVRQGKRDFPTWPICGPTERDLIDKVTRSGQWWRVTDPSCVETFEKAFAAYHDSRFGFAVTNGTAALEVAVQALELDAGDEVIVPPYTFFATASCVLSNNLIPVFVDIDPGTYNLDPRRIEEAITPRTRAIIPVHFAGLPADMDAILQIAARHGLAVIEDCAHAHGATWKGRKLGSFGIAGCFSFQHSKNMTAGEGGAILSQDEEYHKRCFSYHFFGREEGRPPLEYCRLGSNHRMTEFQGAILMGQLERVEEQTRIRAENGAFLSERLSNLPGIVPVESDDPRVTRRAYHIYVFQYHADAFQNASKEQFVRALNAEGIPAHMGYATTVYQNPVFRDKRFPMVSQNARDVDYTSVCCPAAEQAVREAVTLPHPLLLAEPSDMDDIADAIEKIRINAGELHGIE